MKNEENLKAIKAKVEEIKANNGIGLNEYDTGFYNGVGETCDEILTFINSLTQKYKFQIGDTIRVKTMQCFGRVFVGVPIKILGITSDGYLLEDGNVYPLELQHGWELVEKIDKAIGDEVIQTLEKFNNPKPTGNPQIDFDGFHSLIDDKPSKSKKRQKQNPLLCRLFGHLYEKPVIVIKDGRRNHFYECVRCGRRSYFKRDCELYLINQLFFKNDK